MAFLIPEFGPPEVLSQRTKGRGMTVDDYRRDNFLRTEISSQDVAELVTTLCRPAFSKATGAQFAIDGGSRCWEEVIQIVGCFLDV
jgi:hypothetical protein